MIQFAALGPRISSRNRTVLLLELATKLTRGRQRVCSSPSFCTATPPLHMTSKHNWPLRSLSSQQQWKPKYFCQFRHQQHAAATQTTSPAARIENFILPDIGEGIKEVAIKEWHVKIGDSVRDFDPICEVESDKATATISSRFNGTITELHYQVGDMAAVGRPLVDIQLNESSDVEAPKAYETEPSKVPAREPAASSERVGSRHSQDTGDIRVATLPSVRRMAREHNIDLTKIKPSGRFGRVLKEDLLAFMDSGPVASAPSTSAAAANQNSSETWRPLSSIQRAMYKTMTQSLKIPHFNYSDEVDMSKLIDLRTQINSRLTAKDSDNKVGQLAFVIKFLSLALSEFPQLNASLDEKGENLIEKHNHNIGVAVDTKNGLIVPNIKSVQSLSITQVNYELSRLRKLAYDSKLTPADLSGGTISLSNIGSVGGVFGVPVIVSPEILIGAIGRTRKLPRFNNRGDVEAQHIMQVVWSADHRCVDGATLSRFSNFLKHLIEQPESALLKLK